MAAQLDRIYRHPVKGIGAEALQTATLTPDGALKGDRAWALLNANAPDSDGWQPRRNFLQVASGPGLAGVRAATEGGGIRLSHADLPDLVVSGPEDGAALGAWVAPLWPEDRPGPTRLVRAPGHGMTDMPDPFVSLGNLSSLRALSQKARAQLDPRRFRINLWVEGLAPWEEFDLIGKDIRVGAVTLTAAEPIGRCRAPEANPDTGQRDVNVCRVLEDGWDHTDFGIYLRITEGGDIAVGDPVS